MSDKLTIHLTILDRDIPLSIPVSEEEKFREANKRINETVSKFRQRYANVDAQTLLNMAIIQLTRNLLDVEQNLQKEVTGDELERVCEELDEFIKINQ